MNALITSNNIVQEQLKLYFAFNFFIGYCSYAIGHENDYNELRIKVNNLKKQFQLSVSNIKEVRFYLFFKNIKLFLINFLAE